LGLEYCKKARKYGNKPLFGSQRRGQKSKQKDQYLTLSYKEPATEEEDGLGRRSHGSGTTEMFTLKREGGLKCGKGSSSSWQRSSWGGGLVMV